MDLDQEIIRKHLIDALYGKLSHITFDEVVNGFPPFAINEQIKGIPNTAWQLVDHMRVCQSDILKFIQDPDYTELSWPKDYWSDQLASVDDWDESIARYYKERSIIESLIMDANTNLTAPLPYANDFTLFREIIILANHQSYHTGQLMQLKRMI